jgi:2-polyprenyl-6-methoxyphenol hydroxylase-like FAD-dependent oxidoreductase
MPHVHVVGAGPVGLSFAIQAKLLLNKRQMEADVSVSEHHTTYKRQHLVRLTPESIQGMIELPAFNNLQKQLRLNCAIRTHDLEKLLLREARALGIKIIYEHIDDPKQLPIRYPGVSHLVGADGSHSLCRTKIFKNELLFKRPLQYAIEVKYEINQQGQRLPTDKILALEEAFGSFRPIEYIGKFKAGVTPITLWILVDPSIYMAMAPATFKEPYNLRQDSHKIPPKLLTSIQNWLQARCQLFGEVRSSERITRLELTAYSSYHVTRHENGVQWCLVGDAALGVPFFRSLNNGMLSATSLAQAISQDIIHSGSNRLDQRIKRTLISWTWKLLPSSLKGCDAASSAYLKLYAIQQTWLAYKEYTRAYFKSWVIRFLSFLLWLKSILANEWYGQMDLEPFARPITSVSPVL